MPFVETLTGTYGTPGFNDILDNAVANALQQYRIDNIGEQAFVMQKAFDASAKSITTSDQMIQNAINMKK